MTRSFQVGIAALGLCCLVGCPNSDFTSQGGQWRVEAPVLVTGAYEGIGNDTPVLAGTEICAVPTYKQDVPEGYTQADVLDECVEQTIDGPGVLEDGCLLLQGAGEVTWYLDPTECPLQEAGLDLLADQVIFDVAGSEDVTAGIHQWVEEYSEEDLEPGSGDSFPADWTNPPGEPFGVLAGQRFVFFVRLLAETTGRSVAWAGPEGDVSVRRLTGSFREIDITEEPGWIVLELDSGAEVELVLTVDEQEWIAGRVVAVDEDAPASLEIVAGYLAQDEAESAPFGARAVVRDAEGRLIFGTPVTWRVTYGSLAVAPWVFEEEEYTSLPGADYTTLRDECVRPSARGGARSVTLEASHGGLTDEVEIAWIGTAYDSDEVWEPSRYCQSSGCSCSAMSSPRSGWGAAVLAALAVVGIRRWRRDFPG